MTAIEKLNRLWELAMDAAIRERAERQRAEAAFVAALGLALGGHLRGDR